MAGFENGRLVYERAKLLLHALECPQESLCRMLECRALQNVLQHMKTCTDGTSCRTLHCLSSRQILSHLGHCQNRNCSVCKRLRLQIPTIRRFIPSSQTAKINNLLSEQPPANIRPNVPRVVDETNRVDNIVPNHQESLRSEVNLIPAAPQGDVEFIKPTDWRTTFKPEVRSYIIDRM